MDAGLLSLKWNNHSSTFFHVLETIRKKGLYSDVTLACDGKFFEVHKLVLSTCSDYFQEMFEKTQCKHPIIVLKDISNKDLESLLNYMYIGEVNVLQNDLSSLIKAAECLKVKGLAVPDEPPPTKKSNKRQSEREEGSVSKRNRKSGSSLSSEQNNALPSGNDGLDDQLDHRENYVPPRLSVNESDSSIMKEYEPVTVKVEKSEEIISDDYDTSNVTSVKMEQFSTDPGERNPLDIPESGDFSNVIDNGAFSSQAMATGDNNQNFPSTSGYDESSNWSGDIETIDDDDDEGGIDMGGYDPSTFLDSSQADKAPMGSTLSWSPAVSELTLSYIMKYDGLWSCTYGPCTYRSSNKHCVMKHIRRHTGEKPYTCPVCPSKFCSSSDLYRHSRAVHKKK